MHYIWLTQHFKTNQPPFWDKYRLFVGKKVCLSLLIHLNVDGLTVENCS